MYEEDSTFWAVVLYMQQFGNPIRELLLLRYLLDQLIVEGVPLPQ